jgi:hypothetical protein
VHIENIVAVGVAVVVLVTRDTVGFGVKIGK